MVDKISGVIGRPVRNIRIRLHIDLAKQQGDKVVPFHNEFEYNGKTYQSFDYPRYITIEYMGGNWSKDKSIMITERNLFAVKQAFRKMVRNLYTPDIFVQKKTGEIILPEDMKEKYTVNIYDLGMNQFMILKPAIVSDADDELYEGVSIFFNKTAIVASVSVSEFEALAEIIDKLDIFLYSNQLLMMYLQCANKVDIIKKVEEKRNNIFAQDLKEVMKGNAKTEEVKESER